MVDGILVDRLNGARVQVPGSPQVWLIFHGLRHHVADGAVYKALFGSDMSLIYLDSVDFIALGPELTQGTCLAKAHNKVQIYLLTEYSLPRKYLIPSYETFLDFGFAEDQVKLVPEEVLRDVESGRDITSAFPSFN